MMGTSVSAQPTDTYVFSWAIKKIPYAKAAEGEFSLKILCENSVFSVPLWLISMLKNSLKFEVRSSKFEVSKFLKRKISYLFTTEPRSTQRLHRELIFPL